MTQHARQDVRRRLHDQIDAIGARIVMSVAREIPAYAEMGETQIRETRAIAMWAVERLVDLWVEESELDHADLQRFRGIGVSRANDGRPLLVVLRAYRVAAVETSDTLIALGDGLEMDDVVALNRVLLTSVDQLSEALFTGYTSGSERLTSDRESSLQRLFDDMVAGRQTSAASLRDRAAQLGLVVPARASLVLVRSASTRDTPSDDDLAGLVSAVTAPATGEGPHAPMVLRRRTTEMGAILAPSFTELAAELDRRSLIGCAVEGFAVADLPSAHRLAAVALERAPDEAFDGRCLLSRGDALVIALLHRQPTVAAGEMGREVLGPLLRPENDHLLNGLAAFMRAGSAVEGAAALGLHPQTMRHRMRRVSALTGRDPRRAWDRLVLDLARTEVHIGAAG